MGQNLNLLLALIGSATSSQLVETYRLTDVEIDAAKTAGDADEFTALASVRGAITNELQARFPHVVDEWCARLDVGDDCDLLDLYLQEMNK